MSLFLQFEGGCNALATSGNTGDINTDLPDTPTPLQEHQAFLLNQYTTVYNQLQLAGNTQAIERLFTLREVLTSNGVEIKEDYNTSFKSINL